MSKFSERLKSLRKANGITLIQLALETNLSKSAIAFWESDERVPNANAIITLARYFEVSCDYLLGESDIATPKK